MINAKKISVAVCQGMRFQGLIGYSTALRSTAGNRTINLGFHNAEDRRFGLPNRLCLVDVAIQFHEFVGLSNVNRRLRESDAQMRP